MSRVGQDAQGLRGALWWVGMLVLLIATSVRADAAGRDPLTDPDAVKHHIDRSAMRVPIQGWSRDLKFPVYPIEVVRASNSVYYTTTPLVPDSADFDFDALRCEIGDADRAVLKLDGYACADGVCMTPEGGILGTDPRRPVNKKHRC